MKLKFKGFYETSYNKWMKMTAKVLLEIRYRSVSLCMRNSEATKETILKRSGILFNTKGYKATSISNITDATGLTKGAIYRHFTNKHELELETLMHLSTIMFEKLSERIREKTTAGEKLRAVFKFFESYINSPPVKGGCPLMNAAVEADDAHPMLRKGAVKILTTYRESLLAILSNGIKHKQIRPEIDKEMYATLFFASLEGAIMMSKLTGNENDIKRTITFLEKQLKEIEV